VELSLEQPALNKISPIPAATKVFFQTGFFMTAINKAAASPTNKTETPREPTNSHIFRNLLKFNWIYTSINK
jgi:hypothetical protein